MAAALMNFVTTTAMMSLVVLVVLWASIRLMYVVPAKIRYGVWVVVLVGLIVPFRPLFGGGMFTVPVPTISNNNVVSPVEQVAPQQAANTAATTASGTADETSQAVSAPQATPTSDTQWIGWVLGGVWALGFSVSLGRHVLAYRKLQRLLRRWGGLVDDPHLLALFEAAKERKGLQEDKRIELWRCSLVKSPLLTGFRPAMVVLPHLDMSDEELALILEHELTHYEHKDLYINLLSIVAVSIHWFNPLVHWGVVATQETGEAFCDETITAGRSEQFRHFYGEVIISMIERVQGKQVALSTCFYSKKINLKRRLLAIVRTNKNIKQLSAALLVGVLGMVIVSGSVLVVGQTVTPTLSLSEAQERAFAAAGVTADQVQLHRAALAEENGVRVYHIEFYHNDQLVHYVINEQTGAIVSATRPATVASASVPSATITVDEAQTIALADAGLTADQVTFIKTQYDADASRNEYEIAFYSGSVVHDYDIDAATGAIKNHQTNQAPSSVPTGTNTTSEPAPVTPTQPATPATAPTSVAPSAPATSAEPASASQDDDDDDVDDDDVDDGDDR